MNTRALIAEFIGTFALVFIGAGTAALGVVGPTGVALSFGLVVLAFVYAFGHISGTHLNPAITIGLWVGKQIDAVNAIGYIVIQLIAGIIAAFTLAFLLSSFDTTLGATVLGEGVTPLQGLVMEVIVTFFLVNTVYHTAVVGKGGNLAGVAIGMTLTFGILLAGPITGGSLNPARTLGPAIASGNYANIWIYFIGPPLGAILAALLYQGVLKEKE